MRSAPSIGPPLGFELQRRFRASAEQLFQAWTQPAALREWWCPPGWVAAEIEIDLRIGGSYRIAMVRAGRSDAVAVTGKFLDVQPPRRLVYTWRWEGAFDEMPTTCVTIELYPSRDETVLVLRHEKFVDPRRQQQHRSGWIAACNRLDRLVTPLGVDHF